MHFLYGGRDVLQVVLQSKAVIFHFVKSIRKMSLARNISRRE